LALKKDPFPPVCLVFVGALSEFKGPQRAVEVVAELKSLGLSITLDIVGDGPAKSGTLNRAKVLNVDELVNFHGWVPRDALGPFLAKAHFIVLPSESEGWPKVLSEGMAYGAIPIATQVGAIPNILGELGVGVAVDPFDTEGMAEAICTYVNDPERWRDESARCVDVAQKFSYREYLLAVKRLLQFERDGLGVEGGDGGKPFGAGNEPGR